MKKIILIIFSVILITGCSLKKNDVQKIYNEFNNNSSYQVEVQVNGKFNGRKLRQKGVIQKYKDEEIYSLDYKTERLGTQMETTDEIETIIINNHYLENNGQETSRDINSIRYTNPNLYIDALKNASNVKSNIDGSNNKYYTFYVKADDVNKMLEDIKIEIRVNKDVEVKAYVDNNNQIESIEYSVIPKERDNQVVVSIYLSNYNDITPFQFISEEN